MRSTFLTRVLNALLIGLAFAVTCDVGAKPSTARTFGPQRGQDRNTPTPQNGPRFTLTQSQQNPTEFDLILSDGEESSVSGTFFIDQLYNFRDLLLEAKKFAFSDEAVGKDDAVTTRFSNKEERAFAIDVSKQGPQSRFFVSIKTLLGQITVNAGAISRTDKREEGLFFDILNRVQSQIAKSTGQPAK